MLIFRGVCLELPHTWFSEALEVAEILGQQATCVVANSGFARVWWRNMTFYWHDVGMAWLFAPHFFLFTVYISLQSHYQTLGLSYILYEATVNFYIVVAYQSYQVLGVRCLEALNFNMLWGDMWQQPSALGSRTSGRINVFGWQDAYSIIMSHVYQLLKMHVPKSVAQLGWGLQNDSICERTEQICRKVDIEPLWTSNLQHWHLEKSYTTTCADTRHEADCRRSGEGLHDVIILSIHRVIVLIWIKLFLMPGQGCVKWQGWFSKCLVLNLQFAKELGKTFGYDDMSMCECIIYDIMI